MNTAPSLTPKRAAVLQTVTDSGASHESPLRRHGADFRAGLWLYEHDMLGMRSNGFYPVPPFGKTVRELEGGSVLVKLTIPETARIEAMRGISYIGYARFYGVWAPSTGWAVKRAYSGRELVGAPTIKAALVDAKAST